MSLYWDVDLCSVPAIPVGEGNQVQLSKRGGNHFTYMQTMSEANRVIVRVAR